MNETKFTPGPWTFENWVRVSDGGDCPLYIKSKNGTIADMNFNVPTGIGSVNCTANAKLIAAAPDLLDAAKYAMECLERLNTELGQIGDNGDQAYNALKAAFEKAIT